MAASSSIPKMYRKLVAASISQNFREAVKIQSQAVPLPATGQLLVRSKYAGINASDVNMSAGRYKPGVQPPLDLGFEGLGKVVQVGEKCGGIKPGDLVSYMHFGSFSEYCLVPAKGVFPVPNLDPRFIALIVSGLTASISLERMGDLRPGETVLVTAAAGGTGMFAVQLAKLAGCHVIGTCSSEEKMEFLRRIGCDRPVNYKKEKLDDVLRKEYPRGLDVVYEGVGGDMLNTCVKNLAIGGRLIVIGFISSYQSKKFASPPTLPLYQILLTKSASMRGFFLEHFRRDFPAHFEKIASMVSAGKLVSEVSRVFNGLDGICDAVDFLYTGDSIGKIVVDLQPEQSKL